MSGPAAMASSATCGLNSAASAPVIAGPSTAQMSPSSALSAWLARVSSGPAIVGQTARAVAISGGAISPATPAAGMLQRGRREHQHEQRGGVGDAEDHEHRGAALVDQPPAQRRQRAGADRERRHGEPGGRERPRAVRDEQHHGQPVARERQPAERARERQRPGTAPAQQGGVDRHGRRPIYPLGRVPLGGRPARGRRGRCARLFSTRASGDLGTSGRPATGAVLANRERLAGRAGASWDEIALGHQVHGTTVLTDAEPGADADGQISTSSGPRWCSRPTACRSCSAPPMPSPRCTAAGPRWPAG